MIIMFGTRLYGKVDRVPGLFYVASHFAYLNYVPLFPTGSYLVFEGSESGEQFRGVPLGINGKSVMFGYLRAVSLLVGVALIALGFVALMDNDVNFGIALIVAGIVAELAFLLSYRLGRPSPARALALANRAGIPPETIARAFVTAGLISEQHDLEAFRESVDRESSFSA